MQIVNFIKAYNCNGKIAYPSILMFDRCRSKGNLFSVCDGLDCKVSSRVHVSTRYVLKQ